MIVSCWYASKIKNHRAYLNVEWLGCSTAKTQGWNSSVYLPLICVPMVLMNLWFRRVFISFVSLSCTALCIWSLHFLVSVSPVQALIACQLCCLPVFSRNNFVSQFTCLTRSTEQVFIWSFSFSLSQAYDCLSFPLCCLNIGFCLASLPILSR